jgi:hypothetical protein
MYTPDSIADNWLKAFNKKDLDGLLALYSDNAEHFSPKLKLRKPETEGKICGKPAMLLWWADAFERLPSLYYKPIRITANSSRVFMEYTRIVESEPDMDVAELLEIEAGLIVASRVYHG